MGWETFEKSWDPAGLPVLQRLPPLPALESTHLQMTAPKGGLIWRTWDLFVVGSEE